MLTMERVGRVAPQYEKEWLAQEGNSLVWGGQDSNGGPRTLPDKGLLSPLLPACICDLSYCRSRKYSREISSRVGAVSDYSEPLL